MKYNKIWTVLGFLLFVTGIIDIIFYWPTSGEVLMFLTKQILYILVGSFLICEHLINTVRTNNRCSD